MEQLITLIGMSNSGKSHWSGLLQERGFTRYCCDDLIEKKLGPELQALGYAGIQDVAKWMGQPFDPQYPEKSKKYLDFEGEVVREVLEEVGRSKARRVVIDTTGSVIYLAPNIQEALSARTLVVYLETSDTVKDEMYRNYLKNQKPVIWGNSFSRVEGETDVAALARCYPDLLAYRGRKYGQLAHIRLSYETLHDPDFTIDQFIQAIRK